MYKKIYIFGVVHDNPWVEYDSQVPNKPKKNFVEAKEVKESWNIGKSVTEEIYAYFGYCSSYQNLQGQCTVQLEYHTCLCKRGENIISVLHDKSINDRPLLPCNILFSVIIYILTTY